MEGATLQELKSAVEGALEHSGVLGKLKAEVRAEVYKTLDEAAIPRTIKRKPFRNGLSGST